MRWSKAYYKIINSKKALKNLLKERVVENSNSLIIYEPPLSIEIRGDEIIFFIENEISAILDEKGLSIFEEDVRSEIEDWCVALSSLGFKRYRWMKK